jgi:hypothetical protein
MDSLCAAFRGVITYAGLPICQDVPASASPTPAATETLTDLSSDQACTEHVIAGQVIATATDFTPSLAGMQIYLLRAKAFHVLQQRPCLAEKSTAAAHPDNLKVPAGPVEVLEGPVTVGNDEFTKVTVSEAGASAWICSRSGSITYAKYVFERDTEPAAICESDGKFSIDMSQQPNLVCKVHSVAPGFLDGAIVQNGQYDVAVTAPANVGIQTTYVGETISEADLVSVLGNFKNYGYVLDSVTIDGTRHAPQYPSVVWDAIESEMEIDLAESLKDSGTGRLTNCSIFTFGFAAYAWWCFASDTAKERFKSNGYTVYSNWQCFKPPPMDTETAVRSAFNGACTVGMATAMSIDDEPRPWTLIQTAGHSQIVIDYDRDTDRVLLLEASTNKKFQKEETALAEDGKPVTVKVAIPRPASTGVDADGVRFRKINHIDAFENASPQYTPGPAWWSVTTATWKELKKKNIKCCARLHVHDLKWLAS